VRPHGIPAAVSRCPIHAPDTKRPPDFQRVRKVPFPAHPNDRDAMSESCARYRAARGLSARSAGAGTPLSRNLLTGAVSVTPIEHEN
jgi:hypothetical protein